MHFFRFKKKPNSLVCSVVSCSANDYRPYLLRKNTILGALALVVFIEIFVLAHSYFAFRNANYLASVLPGVVSALTNDARAAENLSALTYDETLARAAQAKAEDMAKNGYFAHVAPDGTLPWYWLDQVQYEYGYAGENLAVHFSDSEKLVDAWLASPTHRANILKENFTALGVGMATGTYKGKETLFIVQFFASPRRAPVAASVTPPSVTPSSSEEEPTPEELFVSEAREGTILGATATGTPRETVVALSASPFSTATYFFGGIVALFLLVLLVAYLVSPHVPRLPASAGGLAVVACALLILMFNLEVLGGSVTLPAEDASASVIEAF